jgi:hypothetical protein
MKAFLIAAAVFATLIVTSVTEADARAGYRGGGYRGGGAYRGVARGYRGYGGYRGVARGYRGNRYRRYGYGLAAAGVGAAAYYGANAASYGGCGVHAYFDRYYRVCRSY